MTDPARIAAHPVEPLFVDRWSPRAFDETPIDDGALASLLEAARWAPSSMNAQPWRIIYARRDTAAFARFLDVLVPANRAWAHRASVGLLFLSDTLTQSGPDAEPRPSHSHSFDTGAAWALLALQATSLGLAAHGMTGVDFARAREVFAVPERLRIECAAVVGRRGDKAVLPEQQQAREVPSGRKPIDAFAFEGDLPAGVVA